MYFSGIYFNLKNTAQCGDGKLKVTSESNSSVEICINGMYLPVCDDSWDIEDVNVACRQFNPASSGKVKFDYYIELNHCMVCII